MEWWGRPFAKKERIIVLGRTSYLDVTSLKVLKLRKSIYQSKKKKDVASPWQVDLKRPHLILLDSIRKDRKGQAVD